MIRQSWDETAAKRARIRGCLLGGAIGDALGNPIEFLSLGAIRETHGGEGVTTLVPDGSGVAGLVTDDTQMTLFTAEGLIRAHARSSSEGVEGSETAAVRHAYLRWLDTQNHPAPPPAQGTGDLDLVRTGWLRTQPWLYARRAPGNACLSGLTEEHVPAPRDPLDGTPGPVNPGSKGCGTVMRSAPFGLTGLDPRDCFELAARCAQITHGHPTGYYAAGALAAMVACLLDGESLEGATLRALELLARYPRHEETTAALRKAVDLAAEGDPTPEKAEWLGGGWVAEEALAIAVYSALAHTPAQRVHYCPGGEISYEPAPPRTPVQAALLLSVNHSGDSDSTGSICGNLLGAHHGDLRLPPSWLARIEGRGTIAELADDFASEFHRSVEPYEPYDDVVFPRDRYPLG
ncbi:ADP-ribosylglycohydrolase family protein [Streptomyces malaysiensis]|uniref:ADP-ribosylglycohydrolase family protein n=1 Tax=Streptomyces malaysiensis subsp. samsunensis TaxID=459658 RepID=A0A9X2M2N6_STRMQ|nr:ADP-ribosylglycohydrolase family protein [Streptomyces samsunensis]MCQ8834526.1 ADP-ribosylglycohydrolase family protein [Streptomyces samsunensis]